MGNIEATYVVTFDCRHVRIWQANPPIINETVWCPQCRKEVKVLSAPAEWRIRCRDCAYSRPFGTGKTGAEIAAAKHRQAHPGHVIEIRNGNVIANVFGLRDQTVTTSSSSCDPECLPF